jgi:protein arginine kinase
LFEEVLQRSGFWTSCGPFSHIVLSSRLRLARNMQHVPFPGRSTRDELRPIRDAVERFSRESIYGGGVNVIDLKEIDGNEKRYLRERNIITHEMEESENALVLVGLDDDFSILVNEEDHFRIQVILPGLQLAEAYRIADRVDTELNRFVIYAFTEDMGYLTTCPSNLGTGLKVSVLLHLPAITTRNRIDELIPADKKNIVELKGTVGHMNKNLGCLYQLSSRISFGLSEIDIIETVDEALGRVLGIEDAARDEYVSESRLELEDKIWRSYGILMHSRRMSYMESMDHLSNMRLGIILAFIKNLDIKTINDCMVNIQWAHLQMHYGLLFKSTSESDEYRSEYIRKNLSPNEVR